MLESQTVADQEERIGTLSGYLGEDALKIRGAAHPSGLKVEAQHASRLSHTSLHERAFAGLAAFHTTATVARCGIASASSCNRLGNISGACVVAPMIFPPGRAKLATTPGPTGSIALGKTTGIVWVAFLTARAAGVVVTMIRSRGRRVRAAANS